MEKFSTIDRQAILPTKTIGLLERVASSQPQEAENERRRLVVGLSLSRLSGVRIRNNEPGGDGEVYGENSIRQLQSYCRCDFDDVTDKTGHLVSQEKIEQVAAKAAEKLSKDLGVKQVLQDFSVLREELLDLKDPNRVAFSMVVPCEGSKTGILEAKSPRTQTAVSKLEEIVGFFKTIREINNELGTHVKGRKENFAEIEEKISQAVLTRALELVAGPGEGMITRDELDARRLKFDLSLGIEERRQKVQQFNEKFKDKRFSINEMSPGQGIVFDNGRTRVETKMQFEVFHGGVSVGVAVDRDGLLWRQTDDAEWTEETKFTINNGWLGEKRQISLNDVLNFPGNLRTVISGTREVLLLDDIPVDASIRGELKIHLGIEKALTKSECIRVQETDGIVAVLHQPYEEEVLIDGQKVKTIIIAVIRSTESKGLSTDPDDYLQNKKPQLVIDELGNVHMLQAYERFVEIEEKKIFGVTTKKLVHAFGFLKKIRDPKNPDEFIFVETSREDANYVPTGLNIENYACRNEGKTDKISHDWEVLTNQETPDALKPNGWTTKAVLMHGHQGKLGGSVIYRRMIILSEGPGVGAVEMVKFLEKGASGDKNSPIKIEGEILFAPDQDTEYPFEIIPPSKKAGKEKDENKKDTHKNGQVFVADPGDDARRRK